MHEKLATKSKYTFKNVSMGFVLNIPLHELQLLHTVHDLMSNLNKKITILLDLTKAFDKVFSCINYNTMEYICIMRP